MKPLRCVFLCFVLLLSFCGCSRNDPSPEEDEVVILEEQPLLNGGELVVFYNKTYYEKSGETELLLDFAFARVEDDTVYLDYLWLDSSHPEQETWIFYQPERKQEISYVSGYRVIHNDLGDEALIFVFPPRYYKTTPYEESPAHADTPYDTLGTKPLYIRSEKWNFNYPLWIFDVSLENLPEDYELHYSYFVLTAEDLLSGTWSPPG